MGAPLQVVEIKNTRQEAVVEVLKKWLERAESGQLQEVVVIGLTADGKYGSQMSESENTMAIAAYMISTALRRMDFKTDSEE